jgi:hypothetical protein
LYCGILDRKFAAARERLHHLPKAGNAGGARVFEHMRDLAGPGAVERVRPRLSQPLRHVFVRDVGGKRCGLDRAGAIQRQHHVGLRNFRALR